MKAKDKKYGDGIIMTMMLVFFVIIFVVLIGEVYRVHILQQEIEYQLQRCVNCAVEYAMGDSYRQDRIVNLDVDAAKSKFYEYLSEDVGLDSGYRKVKDGQEEYKIAFERVSGTSNPAVFNVKGTAYANSIFTIFSSGIRIPFDISSTNYRLD